MKHRPRLYTRRENARRAGVAAGIPSERVALTVHKDGDEVRFGWKESPTPVKKAVTTASKVPKVEQENATGEASEGWRVCAAVWAWLDANPAATLKEAKAVAPMNGWNENNVSCEFYARRKFPTASAERPSELTYMTNQYSPRLVRGFLRPADIAPMQAADRYRVPPMH